MWPLGGDIRGYKGIYGDIRGYTGGDGDIREKMAIYGDIRGYTGIYGDIRGYTEIYGDLCTGIWATWLLDPLAAMWPHISVYPLTSPSMAPYMGV